MKIFQGQNDANRVELSSLLVEFPCKFDVLVELSTFHKFHDKVNVFRVLERMIEFNQKRTLRLVFYLLNDVLLVKLLLVFKIRFLQAFQCKVLGVIDPSYKHNFPKGAMTKYLLLMEITELHIYQVSSISDFGVTSGFSLLLEIVDSIGYGFVVHFLRWVSWH